MQNLNPRKYNTPRSYNANCYQDRMGFALRDEATTLSTSFVGVINPLGASIADKMQRLQTGDVSEFWHYNANAAQLVIPGIMSLSFEPVFAPQSTDRKQIVEDIFNNWWSVYRLYYNGADKIQPSDIAIRSMAQMLIDMYVQYIRRMLTVIKATYSANNNYVRNTALLRAMGIQAPTDVENYDFYLRTHFTEWVNYFNQSILGSLNACKWIGGIFPGEHRWSSLCTEIYKDESIDSDYVQTYMLTPRSFYEFKTTQVEPGVYAWKLERGEWPSDIPTLLTKVHDFIRAVYYDSSALDIQAMLQTITVRGKSNETMIYDLSYDLYPLEGEQLKFTFDWAMLMAIHNSTVMIGLRAFDVTQDPSTGRVMQDFAFDTTGSSAAFFRTPKIINMPNFAASQEDMINAIQWSVTGSEDDILPGSTINPGVLGTDVLVDARIWTYDISTNEMFDSPMYQVLASTLVPTDDGDKEAVFDAAMISFMRTSQFNMHPLSYYVHGYDNLTQATRNTVASVCGQLDVVYRGSYDDIVSMKEAFVKNFWGYPIRLRAEGKFSMANKVDSTDAGVGAGSGKSASTI